MFNRNVKNTENVLLLSVETPQNTTKTEMDNSLNEFIEIRKKQHKTVQGYFTINLKFILSIIKIN